MIMRKVMKESSDNKKLAEIVYSTINDNFDEKVLDMCDSIVMDNEYLYDDELSDVVLRYIDYGMIYTDDQWDMMKCYQSPSEANLDEAFEMLTNDMISILSKYYKSVEQPKEEDIEESVRRPRGRMLREGRSSRKVTRSFLKNMVEDGEAVDITNYSDEQLHELEKKEHRLKEIGYGLGVYGVNCGWYRGENTGTNYVVLARNSNLFYLG